MNVARRRRIVRVLRRARRAAAVLISQDHVVPAFEVDDAVAHDLVVEVGLGYEAELEQEGGEVIGFAPGVRDVQEVPDGSFCRKDAPIFV